MAATMLSVIFTLMVESPIIALEKIIFTSTKRPILPTNESRRSRRHSTQASAATEETQASAPVDS